MLGVLSFLTKGLFSPLVRNDMIKFATQLLPNGLGWHGSGWYGLGRTPRKPQSEWDLLGLVGTSWDQLLGLKIRCPSGRAGSNPAPGTNGHGLSLVPVLSGPA